MNEELFCITILYNSSNNEHTQQSPASHLSSKEVILKGIKKTS